MLKKLILKLIRFYQSFSLFHTRPLRVLFLSDRVCRFRPPCSEYTYQAIERYGIIRGGLKGLRRILKCHPWSKGGEDPVK